jgi:hypothetical protein
MTMVAMVAQGEHRLHVRVEPGAVRRVDEPVLEDAPRLMDPEVEELVRGADALVAGGEQALDDLGEVAEVEGVVALLRRRQQLVGDLVVDLDRRAHDRAADGAALLGELEGGGGGGDEDEDGVVVMRMMMMMR